MLPQLHLKIASLFCRIDHRWMGLASTVGSLVWSLNGSRTSWTFLIPYRSPSPPPPPINHQEGQVAGSASRGTPRRFRVVIKRTLQGGRCGVTRIECGVFTAYRMASLTTMLLRLLLRSRKHKIRSHLCSQEEINCFLLALRDTELDIVLPLWRIY